MTIFILFLLPYMDNVGFTIYYFIFSSLNKYLHIVKFVYSVTTFSQSPINSNHLSSI